MDERPRILVKLGEPTPLKTALNRGVAVLPQAENTQLRPHVCLNGEEGYEVLQTIIRNPESANTEFCLFPHPIVSGNDIWLNVHAIVYLEERRHPTCCCILSPQQTGCILKNLPTELRTEAFLKVKNWYIQSVLPDLQKGIAVITKQFEEGDPFLESDHHNHIFDIHGGRGMKDIPYTETEIVGENLYWVVVHGETFWEYGSDGYARADALITERRQRQKEAVSQFLGKVRAPHRF
mgnify:CR=1 FL=1